MFHAVKTKDGYSYFIRMGSRNRPMQPHELSRGKEEGVEIEPQSPLEKLAFWLGKKILLKISGSLNSNLSKVLLSISVVGLLSIVGAFFLVRYEGTILDKLDYV